MPRSPRMQSPTVHQKIPVRRACDQCRTSKTKCEGLPGTICKHCDKAGTAAKLCTYNDPIKAKGPKPGSRGSNASSTNQHRRRQSQHTDDSQFTALHQREANIFTPELATLCFNFYRENVQSVLPLLDSARLNNAIAQLQDDETYVQLCAFCAYICRLPTFSITEEWRLTPRQKAAGGNLADQLFDEAKKIRRNLALPHGVTSVTISTSFLISESYRLRGEYDHACAYTCEATNWSVNILHWPDQAQSSTERLIYSTLYIHERLWALQGKSWIAFSPGPPDWSASVSEIDGNNLVPFNRRLEVLRSCDLLSIAEPAQSQNNHDYHVAAHLPEQYHAPLTIAVRHYLGLRDQGDWILDFTPAATWLKKGLKYIVDNYSTIMMPSHTNIKPCPMPTQILADITDVLMKILSAEAMTSTSVTYLREWLRPIWQRLQTGSPEHQQMTIPIYASPTSHAGQVNNFIPTSAHGPISPVHATPVTHCPPSPYSSRNSSFDAAVPMHDRYIPSANLTYQSPMAPMYANLVGPSMEAGPHYGYHDAYGPRLGMGSASH